MSENEKFEEIKRRATIELEEAEERTEGYKLEFEEAEREYKFSLERLKATRTFYSRLFHGLIDGKEILENIKAK